MLVLLLGLHFNVFVGNCDIYFFIFRHRFCIMRLKYLKFERDQNAAEKNSNGINERAEQNHKIQEQDKIIISLCLLLLSFI
jgi:hypothetical protein